MTTVLVTGGSGNLGGHVVQQLLDSGSDVRIASRRLEPSGRESDAVWATVDYRTRAGLAAALAGADVAVHCAGGSAKGESETIAALLSSAKRAGLAHLVYISIVGVDKLPMGYYRAKLGSGTGADRVRDSVDHPARDPVPRSGVHHRPNNLQTADRRRPEGGQLSAGRGAGGGRPAGRTGDRPTGAAGCPSSVARPSFRSPSWPGCTSVRQTGSDGWSPFPCPEG